MKNKERYKEKNIYEQLNEFFLNIINVDVYYNRASTLSEIFAKYLFQKHIVIFISKELNNNSYNYIEIKEKKKKHLAPLVSLWKYTIFHK